MSCCDVYTYRKKICLQKMHDVWYLNLTHYLLFLIFLNTSMYSIILGLPTFLAWSLLEWQYCVNILFPVCFNIKMSYFKALNVHALDLAYHNWFSSVSKFLYREGKNLNSTKSSAGFMRQGDYKTVHKLFLKTQYFPFHAVVAEDNKKPLKT